MSITVPQLLMISHALWVSHERSDRRFARKRAQETVEPEEETPMYMGKPLSELNSEEMKRYYGGFFEGI